jgi:hypothetical protein
MTKAIQPNPEVAATLVHYRGLLADVPLELQCEWILARVRENFERACAIGDCATAAEAWRMLEIENPQKTGAIQ